ncbi:MAG: hypothetical protein IPH53_05740 [Flavobacteriales bacterium]|nr:hypothetical protein [Flavobacteriales bacterium]MBK9074838.1 hypothetical protein [Flavobacteriales bacterium]
MPLGVQAQYGGGAGRGDIVSLFSQANIASDIFSGGDGRGDVAALHAPTVASNIFSGGNGRGEVTSNFSPSLQVLLSLRGMLEGPYSASTGLMSDALRSASLIPGTEPYSALGYAASSGGGEAVGAATLTTTGNNAIVDWVVVELHDNTNPASIVASRAALIQRDGDVVSTNGISPVIFTQAPGTYRVALRHRNHLGAMTLNGVALSNTTTSVDLSLAGTSTFGTQARKSITGTFPTQALWAGDVTFNNQLKYAGSNNDRDPILTAIGGTVPTNTLSGQYRQEDINMNGQVKYAGSANDRDILLQNIGGSVPTAVRNAQLP